MVSPRPVRGVGRFEESVKTIDRRVNWEARPGGTKDPAWREFGRAIRQDRADGFSQNYADTKYAHGLERTRLEEGATALAGRKSFQEILESEMQAAYNAMGSLEGPRKDVIRRFFRAHPEARTAIRDWEAWKAYEGLIGGTYGASRAPSIEWQLGSRITGKLPLRYDALLGALSGAGGVAKYGPLAREGRLEAVEPPPAISRQGTDMRELWYEMVDVAREKAGKEATQ
jgi:hypothetical protein